jgi:hypothetical protein
MQLAKVFCFFFSKKKTFRPSTDLPPGAAGRWCQIRVQVRGGADWWAQVKLADPARGQIVRSVFLGPLWTDANGAWRETLLHVPQTASGIQLRLFGVPEADGELSVDILSRWQAALRLVWQGRHLLAGCLRGNTFGMIGRLRAVLGQAPARAGEAPPYAAWLALCEASMPRPADAPALNVQAVLFGDCDANMEATLASLAAQTVTAVHSACVIGPTEDCAGVTAPWVLVMQAGEVLVPHALAWFARAAADTPDAVCITADFDRLAADGSRQDPVFLPGADALLVQSGLPTAGPCVARWDAGAPPNTPKQAASLRLRLATQAGDRLAHVSRILAHLPADAPVVAAQPVMHAAMPDLAPRVVAVVPSQARSMHVPACLQQILAGPRTARLLRVAVVLSAPGSAHARVLRRLHALPGVEVMQRPMRTFNYAAVNNEAARCVEDADFLLLLNDDVAPNVPDWLDLMLAHMVDPRVGIVGARLLYGNGMVQHEGVILGLADLCEHAGRLRDGADPGPHGIGSVCRQVSAVTAACMLVRASLFHDLAGLDEGFAIALNDVDFCLRARQAGWRTVYCAEAVLTHYESLSLGRHYEGARAALESFEVGRLRDRWSAKISADPCYNPQASLDPGREWQPAFCPRPH